MKSKEYTYGNCDEWEIVSSSAEIARAKDNRAVDQTACCVLFKWDVIFVEEEKHSRDIFEMYSVTLSLAGGAPNNRKEGCEVGVNMKPWELYRDGKVQQTTGLW